MIYFLTENRVKTFTTVLGNVDAQLIMPLIPSLSEMWLQPRIGTYFYNTLLTRYNAATLNVDESALVAIIQSSLLWRVAADITLTSSGQLTNKGPQDQNGINSSQSDLSKVTLLAKHYTGKAEFYDQRIADYLRINKAKFPEFTARENNDASLTETVPTDEDFSTPSVMFT